LWNKAKDIHKYLRKWYAYWLEECDSTGKFPSGTNESDVAAKVLDRIWADERGGLYDEGSGNDESESEGEAAEDEESSGFEKKDGERRSLGAAATEERMEGWRPLYWWVFLLYGPYGAAKFACDVHPLLSINVNTYILQLVFLH